MIAADTSAFIDFSRGSASRAAGLLDKCLQDGSVVIPEPVLFEVLSGPGLTTEAEAALVSLPRLLCLAGYWERAGILRRKLLKGKMKARAMDCLVAQICIDHEVPLITSDRDFKHFSKHGLILL